MDVTVGHLVLCNQNQTLGRDFRIWFRILNNIKEYDLIALCLIESLGAFGSCKWICMDRLLCPQVASLNTGVHVPFVKYAHSFMW